MPRWLWPPPGAQVRALTIVERALRGEPDGSFEVLGDSSVEPLHWRALGWLLSDHPCSHRPAGVPFEGRVLLEIARTALPGGRVGHAYALDGGPLSAPGASASRGVLLRCSLFALRQP